jgi:hypothetical protein
MFKEGRTARGALVIFQSYRHASGANAAGASELC